MHKSTKKKIKVLNRMSCKIKTRQISLEILNENNGSDNKQRGMFEQGR